jgi:hypothetical protein
MRMPWTGRTPARRKERTLPGLPEPNSTIRTSDTGWLTRLAAAYRGRIPVRLVDDADVGIDPQNQSLVSMGISARLQPVEWVAVGVCLGLSAAGIGFVVLAFLDPEPTSKLGLLLGGGAVCALTGGLSAVGILTRRRPPNIEVDRKGFRIRWD